MIENKTASIHVRVAASRLAMYREYAEREGMRLSDWLRFLADQQIAAQAMRHFAKQGQ